MSVWIQIDGDTDGQLKPGLTIERAEASRFFSEAHARQSLRVAEEQFADFTWTIVLDQQANRFVLKGERRT